MQFFKNEVGSACIVVKGYVLTENIKRRKNFNMFFISPTK